MMTTDLSLLLPPTPLAERAAFLRRAVASRGYHALVKEPGFVGTLAALDLDARGAEAEQRLDVVSALGRLLRASKTAALRAPLGRTLAALGELPLDLAALREGDDRYYALVGLQFSRGEWVAGAAAQVAIMEETHEAARSEALSLLWARRPDLTEGLRLLVGELRSWEPSTEKPADTAARRMKRILAALEASLQDYRGEVGAAPGEALAQLLAASEQREGRQLLRPGGKELGELALQLFSTTGVLIRLRLSLSAEPATYNALRSLREWFERGAWERWTSKGPGAEASQALGVHLVEALRLLARQGVCDDQLFERLVVVSGERSRARALAREVARVTPGLREDVQRWLRGEESMPQAASGEQALEEQRRASDDVKLGQILRQASKLLPRLEELQRSLVPEVSIVIPQYEQLLAGALGQGMQLVQQAQGLAELRGVRLRGEVGGVQTYDPELHRLVGEERRGVRRVRLLSPPVERVAENGTVTLLEQGLAEPLDSDG